MKRLTNPRLSETGHVLCDYVKADCDDNCLYSTCPWREKALLRLKEYEDLEENKKLLKLKCKVGDVLYRITRDKSIQEIVIKVIEIRFSNIIYFALIREENRIIPYYNKDFNNGVFFTREEAETVLEKINNNKRN